MYFYIIGFFILHLSLAANITTVFSQGMAGSNCYRIPSIIRSSKGTLLAFSEQRMNNCGDNGNNNIVLRRSLDDGKTWGDIISVAKSGGRPFSNPNPVEVNLPQNKRAILFHYDTMNNPTSSHHGDNMQAWSFDDGLSWTNFTNITSFMPKGKEGCLIGPSVGIQNTKNTIFFSCHGPGLNGFLYWSTDFGKTWQHGQVIESINECSIAFLANESIAMNCRATGGRRAQLTFNEDGSPLSPIMYPEGLQDPNCQGSIISLGNNLYLSNDNTTRGRTHITVKRSQDGGISWDSGKSIWNGPSGYSQLVGWSTGNSNMLGLFFELGDKGTYERIGFTTWES